MLGIKKKVFVCIAVEGQFQAIRLMSFLQRAKIPNILENNIIYTDTLENAEKAKLLLNGYFINKNKE
jgi:hypothetical protein